MKKVVYNSCFGGFSISKECAEWMADRGNVECEEGLRKHRPDWEFGSLSKTPRHDAILVLAVEALGEKASGMSANLKIREITADRYYIDEYDGSESVVTPKDIKWTLV